MMRRKEQKKRGAVDRRRAQERKKSVLAGGSVCRSRKGKSKQVEKRQSREAAGRPGDRGVCEPRSKCTTARQIWTYNHGGAGRS